MEEIPLSEESEKIFSPEIDKGNLYGIILIIASIITLYITIVTHQIWIPFFIIIPLLYISRKEEGYQGNLNLKQRILKELSKIYNFLFILTIIGFILTLFLKIGFIFTLILVLVSFKFYNHFTGVITRRKFEKHNKLKSEVF